MKREPIATTQTRQVRVVVNTLTKDGFLPLLLDYASFRRKENRRFAQSSLFNVKSHSVVSVL